MDPLDCLDRLAVQISKLEAINSVLELPESIEGLGYCLECIAEKLREIEKDLTEEIKKERNLEKVLDF